MSKVTFTLIALLFTFLLGCQSDRDQISKLRDGPSSNKLREKLKVPIIDSYMIKTDDHSFGSDRWEPKEEMPTEGIALHLFKNILPYNKIELSLEEWDGILMKINDSVVHQLNITSKIKDRSDVSRTGELYIYPLNLPESKKNRLYPNRELNEKEIDSIFINWKLYHLVLNN
jgi:hypothetical protein